MLLFLFKQDLVSSSLSYRLPNTAEDSDLDFCSNLENIFCLAFWFSLFVLVDSNGFILFKTDEAVAVIESGSIELDLVSFVMLLLLLSKSKSPVLVGSDTVRFAALNALKILEFLVKCFLKLKKTD